jgi:hypothetical protein
VYLQTNSWCCNAQRRKRSIERSLRIVSGKIDGQTRFASWEIVKRDLQHGAPYGGREFDICAITQEPDGEQAGRKLCILGAVR